MTHNTRMVCLAVLLATSGLSVAGNLGPASTSPLQRDDAYGRLPLILEANAGQADPKVKFIARGSGYGIFLTSSEAVLALRKNETTSVLRMRLAGANRSAATEGQEPVESTSNYFLGNSPERWRTGVRQFRKVRYTGVWPGIDLVYYGNQRRLEYDFVVKPGADPASIRIAFEGAKGLRISPEGDLLIATPLGELRQQRPVVYQETPTGRVLREGRYVLAKANEAAFQIGDYDRSKPLVIDPVLVYSTFVGGTGIDAAQAIAVDASGNAYVTGYTLSTDFPLQGAYQATNRGRNDVFVFKLNSSGTGLVFATFLGGQGDDWGQGIAVDASGSVYVTGYTGSFDFPVQNAYQSQNRGFNAAFVTKLNSSGNALVYSTYLGGTSQDYGQDIAADGSGNAYVCGTAHSSDFPRVNAIYSTFKGGSSDAFVAKFNSSGTPVFSSFLGGSGSDTCHGIAIDGSNAVYAAGWTTSGDFPVAGGFQNVYGGNQDGFVTKLNSALTAVSYSTYLGGSGADAVLAIAVDGGGNAYVTGETASGGLATSGAAQGTLAGGANDAFVAKVNASGNALAYFTYLGGSAGDTGRGIAVDSSGSAYVAGMTQSLNFQSVNPVQSFPGGSGPFAFVTAVNPSGTGFKYSTYLGGTGQQEAFDVAVDGSGNAYVTGVATAGFPTKNAYQATAGGAQDAFVAKIGSGPPPQNAAKKIGVYRGGWWTLDLDGSRTFNSADAQFVWGTSTSTPLVANFDGTGKDTVGIYDRSSSTWYLDMNGNGVVDAGDRIIYNFGDSTTVPVVGDWNSSGTAKIGVYANGLWFLDYNGSGGWDSGDRQLGFGYPGCPCKPVIGDWNGDHRAKIGLFVDDGTWPMWFLDNDGDGQWNPAKGERQISWGPPGSVPLVGDWNGDGRTKIGVFYKGIFILDYNGDETWEPDTEKPIYWGTANSKPVVGDWNGDGRDEIGIFEGGQFYLDLNGNGVLDAGEVFGWGAAGDTPVVGSW